MKIYELFMEGDFGQEGCAFTTKEKAKDYARTTYEMQMGKDEDLPEDEKFDGFWTDYCYVKEMKVDP